MKRRVTERLLRVVRKCCSHIDAVGSIPGVPRLNVYGEKALKISNVLIKAITDRKYYLLEH